MAAITKLTSGNLDLREKRPISNRDAQKGAWLRGNPQCDVTETGIAPLRVYKEVFWRESVFRCANSATITDETLCRSKCS